ncbi:hypothetical protein AXF42_Ash002092 [Apostasia shenzhenica]|uniref:Uncharacterized protein n=1 Tax=Apostasia shenzhenica TaxID=1088818 RepID=A0A2I0AMK6_9ASPA|nr:hypothetical protein AXF42_Ash002092 [Apostasia shenzhenica]
MANDGDELVMDVIPRGAVVSFVYELEEPEGPVTTTVGFDDGEIGVAIVIDEEGEGPIDSSVAIASLASRSQSSGAFGDQAEEHAAPAPNQRPHRQKEGRASGGKKGEDDQPETSLRSICC